MRVCIDAVPLLVRSAGVKNHLYHWIVHLKRITSDGAISLFPFLNRFGELDHEHSQTGPLSTLARLALLHVVNLPGNASLDWLLRGVDVFHACKVINPPRGARLTATLHDMTCWLMPDVHLPENVEAEKRFAALVLRKASGLIAVSENTRCDAARVLGLDPARIQVIYHGVPESYFGVAPEAVLQATHKHNLLRPYILFVGTVEPRKNLPVLLDAYAALPAALREHFELVITGPIGWAGEETIARLHSPDPGIRYLGYIPEPDLPGIFAGATVFTYPSLYEGFGFPLAQAMAAGVTAITSGVSSLPEVAGDAAILVDPRSTQEMTAALERLLLSPALRTELARRARQRAERYRWEICARQSLKFFEQVAGAL